jgi:hypothetical protein
MNRRSLPSRGPDLSSRRTVEDAIESTKRNHDLTWEEAAKCASEKSAKWRRSRRRRSSTDEIDDERHPH